MNATDHLHPSLEPEGNLRSAEAPAPDSTWRWLARGLVAGVIVMGTANAISYLVRSRGWGSLLGDRTSYDEAIGFPWLVWSEGAGYGSHHVSMLAFAADVGTGVLLGVTFGMLAIGFRSPLNRMMQNFRRHNPATKARLQFSLSGLIITTGIAALIAAIARTFAPRVELLAAIYALGPIVLVGLAFAPRGLQWQQRVQLVIPLTVILITLAIALGNVLNVEFDKVLMGIFICWTPQTTLAATLVCGSTLWRQGRQQRQ